MKANLEILHKVLERTRRSPADIELGLILDRISEHIVLQDDQMRVIWANNAAAMSVGQEPGNLIGRHCYEIWHQCSEPCANCP